MPHCLVDTAFEVEIAPLGTMTFVLIALQGYSEVFALYILTSKLLLNLSYQIQSSYDS